MSADQLADLAARIERLEEREEQRDLVARIVCGAIDPSDPTALEADQARMYADLGLIPRPRHLRSVRTCVQ